CPGTGFRGRRAGLMRFTRRALVLATAALACGPVSGASTTGHSRPVPILMYHVIASPIAGAPFPALYVPKGEFAVQMRWLARNGAAADGGGGVAAFPASPVPCSGRFLLLPGRPLRRRRGRGRPGRGLSGRDQHPLRARSPGRHLDTGARPRERR